MNRGTIITSRITLKCYDMFENDKVLECFRVFQCTSMIDRSYDNHF